MRLLIAILFITSALVTFSQTGEQPEYIIKSIYFGGGRYQVDSLQRAELHHFIDSIPDINFYSISIHSHTDNIGGAEYNAWLSSMRGDAVIRELIYKELSRESIVIKDFGQFNPVYDNSTIIGRMRNRRVDIIFWPMVF